MKKLNHDYADSSSTPPPPSSTETREPSQTIPPDLEAQPAAPLKKKWWTRVRWDKIGLFFLSLYLFVLGIILMKDGTRSLSPLIRDVFNVTTVARSLGFGWLFAYIIMSGSPVAAAALAFLDGGIVTELGAFAMITGSRLGASFIVLLIGFLYVLRGRDQANSLGMGLLSLLITATTYIPAFFLGFAILRTGWLGQIQLQRGALLISVTDILAGPVSQLIVRLFPHWAVFLVGIGVIYLSFTLFDKCLPQMAIKESNIGWTSRLVYRPIVMFAVGALVTLISMSVSISLGILVPLSNRGFVRQENVIPYIMGANITTFVDTLLAAVLLDNPQAFTIVLVEMISITLISFVVLVFFFSPYQHSILGFVNRVTKSKLNIALFMSAAFFIPILLILI
jgi:Na+/phosphate symporter